MVIVWRWLWPIQVTVEAELFQAKSPDFKFQNLLTHCPLPEFDIIDKTNRMIESEMVYVGIPSTGAAKCRTFSSSGSTQRTRLNPSSFGHGLLAFVVGMLLSCCAWIANQGWTVVALLVFGDFAWAPSAWKHVLLLMIGTISTTLACSAAFNSIFSSILENDDDSNTDKVGGLSAFEKDVSDALHDLGELGMVTGYIGSMSLFSSLMDKKLAALGIELDSSDNAFNSATMIFMLLWVVFTKMRDYKKAVKRVDSLIQSQGICSYVPKCVELAHEYDTFIRQC